MKKTLRVLFTLSLAFILLFSLAACNNFKAKTIKVEEGEEEPYGFAVQKGTNAEILTKANEIISDISLQMNDLIAYYTALFDGEDAGECPIELPDVSNNTGGTLRVGTEAGFAPFEFMYQNKVTGVDVAIMTLLAHALNKKIDVIDTGDFYGLINELKADKIDIIAAGLSITEERQAEVDFSNPYFSSVQYIVCGSNSGINGFADLAGKKIAVQGGTTGDLLVSDAIREGGSLFEKGSAISPYKQIAVAYEDLKVGRIDAIVIDELPAKALAAQK